MKTIIMGFIIVLLSGYSSFGAVWKNYKVGSNFEYKLPGTPQSINNGKAHVLVHNEMIFSILYSLDGKFYNPKTDKNKIRGVFRGFLAGMNKKAEGKVVKKVRIYKKGFIGIHSIIEIKRDSKTVILESRTFYVGKDLVAFVVTHKATLDKTSENIKQKFFSSVKIKADYEILSRKKSSSSSSAYERGKALGQLFFPFMVVSILIFVIWVIYKKTKKQV